MGKGHRRSRCRIGHLSLRRRHAYSEQIIGGPEYRDPDIWGDYVVCVKRVASEAGPNASEIVLYNLITAETKVIANADKNNEHPRIDGGKVVWSSGNVWTPDAGTNWSNTYQICLYDIGSGETSVLTERRRRQPQPGCRGRPGGLADLDALRHQGLPHLLGRDLRHLFRTHGDTARSPEVDGTRVAWYGSKGLYYAVPASEATRFPDVPTGHHYLTAIEGVVLPGHHDRVR